MTIAQSLSIFIDDFGVWMTVEQLDMQIKQFCGLIRYTSQGLDWLVHVSLYCNFLFCNKNYIIYDVLFQF